ncbi:methylthioribose kinase [Bacillus sp. HMF5848]|uniref:DUF7147 family protein n=1 Tax=Bacillus sp. HMF5848 TaxID=2495421 RepID=UPI000F782DF3|nr:methylthioribose kinase [Bacillus sp. HMF5848]RSK26917.1 methylthioribose kinase [Bacillus sp. HMF5848]
MIQRFIELGEGYSDIYELLEVANNNKHRITKLLALQATINNRNVFSLVVILTPTDPGNFQPLYICREGIPENSKRFDLFKELSERIKVPITYISVKSSLFFAERNLYYQYLIGVLRLNHIIPPLK